MLASARRSFGQRLLLSMRSTTDSGSTNTEAVSSASSAPQASGCGLTATGWVYEKTGWVPCSEDTARGRSVREERRDESWLSAAMQAWEAAVVSEGDGGTRT